MSDSNESSSFFFTIKSLRNSALAVLHLAPNASFCMAKAQYRRLSIKYYPTAAMSNDARLFAHENFSKVSAAYELLMTINNASLDETDSTLFSSLNFTDPYLLFKRHCLCFSDIASRTFESKKNNVTDYSAEPIWPNVLGQSCSIENTMHTYLGIKQISTTVPINPTGIKAAAANISLGSTTKRPRFKYNLPATVLLRRSVKRALGEDLTFDCNLKRRCISVLT